MVAWRRRRNRRYGGVAAGVMWLAAAANRISGK